MLAFRSALQLGLVVFAMLVNVMIQGNAFIELNKVESFKREAMFVRNSIIAQAVELFVLLILGITLSIAAAKGKLTISVEPYTAVINILLLIAILMSLSTGITSAIAAYRVQCAENVGKSVWINLVISSIIGVVLPAAVIMLQVNDRFASFSEKVKGESAIGSAVSQQQQLYRGAGAIASAQEQIKSELGKTDVSKQLSQLQEIQRKQAEIKALQQKLV